MISGYLCNKAENHILGEREQTQSNKHDESNYSY